MAGQEKWYFTRDQLANSPTRKCGLDGDKELAYRQQSANLIQDMGQRLQVSQLCINTAIVYMHRFYAFHSFSQFHRNTMAAAALFLAAKVEEQPRKLEYVIKVAHACLRKAEGIAPPDTRTDQYQEQAQDLVFNENVLLQTLGFDVAIDHPHTHVVRTCHLVKAPKDLAQTSYFMASNSLHLTTMCLQYRPTVVACFCIHLASKWSNWAIPQSNEGRHWFSYVDNTVTMELLEKLTAEFLHIFDRCPSRLKRKMMSISNSSSPVMGGPGVTSSQSSIAASPFDPKKTRDHLLTDDMEKSFDREYEREKRRATISSGYVPVSTPAPPAVPPATKIDYREYREKREREERERRHAAARATQQGRPNTQPHRPHGPWPQTHHAKPPTNAPMPHDRHRAQQQLLQSREQAPRDQQTREQGPRDLQSREQVNRDPLSREQVPRDPQSREQVSRDPQSREHLPRDPQSRDLVLRDQVPRNAQSREHVSRDQQSRDQVSREPQTREQVTREQLVSRDLQTREQQICEQQFREQVPRDKPPREQVARDPQTREHMACEQATREIVQQQPLQQQIREQVQQQTPREQPRSRPPSLFSPESTVAATAPVTHQHSRNRPRPVDPNVAHQRRPPPTVGQVQPANLQPTVNMSLSNMMSSSTHRKRPDPLPAPISPFSSPPPAPVQQRRPDPEIPHVPSKKPDEISPADAARDAQRRAAVNARHAHQRRPPHNASAPSTTTNTPTTNGIETDSTMVSNLLKESLFRGPDMQTPIAPTSIATPNSFIQSASVDRIPRAQPIQTPVVTQLKPPTPTLSTEPVKEPVRIETPVDLHSKIPPQTQEAFIASASNLSNAVSAIDDEARDHHRADKKKKKEKHKHKDREKRDERKKRKKDKDKERKKSSGEEELMPFASAPAPVISPPAIHQAPSASAAPIRITIPREKLSSSPGLKIKIPKDRLASAPAPPPSNMPSSPTTTPVSGPLKIKISKDVLENSRKRTSEAPAGPANKAPRHNGGPQQNQHHQRKVPTILGQPMTALRPPVHLGNGHGAAK